MTRILPDDVVKAYSHTGLIPIRCAWNTTDERGCCAIDVVARWLQIPTNELLESLDEGYEDGFLFAWDSDNPRHGQIIDKIKSSKRDSVKRGFCDGLLCRSAVEKTFSSELIPISNDY